MIWQQVVAAVIAAAIVMLLSAVLHELRKIAGLPERMEEIQREDMQAHGDIWRELRHLSNSLDQHSRRFH